VETQPERDHAEDRKPDRQDYAEEEQNEAVDEVSDAAAQHDAIIVVGTCYRVRRISGPGPITGCVRPIEAFGHGKQRLLRRRAALKMGRPGSMRK
jgi:hypothetical protein